jgi:hypothetical protein
MLATKMRATTTALKRTLPPSHYVKIREVSCSHKIHDIRSSFIKRLITMMTPSLIITAGMVEETAQSLRDQGAYP